MRGCMRRRSDALAVVGVAACLADLPETMLDIASMGVDVQWKMYLLVTPSIARNASRDQIPIRCWKRSKQRVSAVKGGQELLSMALIQGFDGPCLIPEVMGFTI